MPTGIIHSNSKSRSWPQPRNLMLSNLSVEKVCLVESMPVFTSHFETASAVFFAGAKVFATFSVDQCLPLLISFIAQHAREPDHTKVWRAWIRNIKNVLFSLKQVTLNEANPHGKNFMRVCTRASSPMMRRPITFLMEQEMVIICCGSRKAYRRKAGNRCCNCKRVHCRKRKAGKEDAVAFSGFF
jgi:hypothetical protein